MWERRRVGEEESQGRSYLCGCCGRAGGGGFHGRDCCCTSSGMSVSNGIVVKGLVGDRLKDWEWDGFGTGGGCGRVGGGVVRKWIGTGRGVSLNCALLNCGCCCSGRIMGWKRPWVMTGSLLSADWNWRDSGEDPPRTGTGPNWSGSEWCRCEDAEPPLPKCIEGIRWFREFQNSCPSLFLYVDMRVCVCLCYINVSKSSIRKQWRSIRIKILLLDSIIHP